MKQYKLSIHIIISIVLCVLLLLKTVLQTTSIIGQIVSTIYGFGQETSSIGIIGGADGPTTVFLSSPFKHLFIFPIIELGVLTYVLIVLILSYQILIKDKMKE